MTTRTAEGSDVGAIAALEAGIFGREAWSETQVADELSAPAHAVVVAERDRLVIGYGCSSVAGDVADLLRIAVAPEFRRTGVASELLEALQEAVTGADRMLLEVASSNVDAQAFYAAHGYAEISRRRRYYASGDDAVVMAHRLG
jgi:ribosomal-protein-alanine N-acetyltransferase